MFLRKVIGGGGGEQKTAVKLYNSLPFIKHGREKNYIYNNLIFANHLPKTKVYERLGKKKRCQYFFMQDLHSGVSFLRRNSKNGSISFSSSSKRANSCSPLNSRGAASMTLVIWVITIRSRQNRLKSLSILSKMLVIELNRMSGKK